MEYAAGGTLAEYISKQSSHFSDFEVLQKFTQICLGLEYIHKKNILHRDLKTQNILLCQNKKIAKIGDFGISKVLTSKSKANTVVGSPSYLSPELCSAKPYNQLSDVWALGCVLYEMMALKRAFDAPSLPQLIQLIVSGKFDPIPPKLYPSQLLFLVPWLLHVDPPKRPTPSDLLQKPMLMKHVIQLHMEIGALPCNGDAQESTKESVPLKKTLVRYYSQVTREEVILPLLRDTHLTRVALGLFTVCGLTNTNTLLEWTWTSQTDDETQLGQFNCTPVETDCEVQGVAAGEDFFMFINSNKVLYSSGSNMLGCLGHGHTNPVPSEPTLVQNLFGWEVTRVACGDQHSVVLTSDNEVFTWGLGHDGRTGQGSTENVFSPTKVVLSGDVVVRDIVAGPDCSAIITTNCELYCCGKNMSNKLLLCSPDEYDVTNQNTHLSFTGTLQLPDHITQIDKLVYSHCHAALLSVGQVYTVGSNDEMQLGRVSKEDELSMHMEAVTLEDVAQDVGVTNRSTLILTQNLHVLQFGGGTLQPRVVVERSPEFLPTQILAVGQKFIVLGHEA